MLLEQILTQTKHTPRMPGHILTQTKHTHECQDKYIPKLNTHEYLDTYPNYTSQARDSEIVLCTDMSRANNMFNVVFKIKPCL